MYIIFIQPLSNHSKICFFFFGGAKWKNRKERSEIYRDVRYRMRGGILMHICVFVSVCQALEMNCVCRNGKHTTNKSETKPKKKKRDTVSTRFRLYLSTRRRAPSMDICGCRRLDSPVWLCTAFGPITAEYICGLISAGVPTKAVKRKWKPNEIRNCEAANARCGALLKADSRLKPKSGNTLLTKRFSQR